MDLIVGSQSTMRVYMAQLSSSGVAYVEVSLEDQRAANSDNLLGLSDAQIAVPTRDDDAPLIDAGTACETVDAPSLAAETTRAIQ